MAGHSKWANIQHRKGAQDAKRAKVFTRYIREITIAARMGGADIESNPRLRAAVSAAKGVNMPKDNIERAISRGAGGSEADNIEEIRYEGYGQAGVAILVDCMTDNRNRTVSDVRSAFSKGGGNMGESGCVSWMFHQKGLFVFDRKDSDEEVLMETALEAGAEDVQDKPEEGCIEVTCAPSDFAQVQDALEAAKLKPQVAEVSWIPENTIQVEGEAAEKLLALIERLEELDDVQNVYANFDISDAEMERLSN
ncbi:MAG: YebC/PmpR family DNA-binding transcriptional regulator [Zetaproteobacteria bacterium CG06_land_8_20_14_3_00_59_53]|nr:MAG: transcriptional regulator [Zetaproteobacteria bacterium CG2_30_59_37]PIO90133.1 MAG: YebC/PmpR family DNA-binding transcriptional regulator [Zetaproteobacteria bacterium CG23_combo_of_CG06-09_8_20_14_all_59_86]PIQ64854.1 MAG: YebC/PmpR family DNA-binding transcriptional regulator [Zetaproteobacteria bacterium CG11_big_fil_rev_8_21_14_0_20_59_439]PIU69533.1 MAG: YebC/PmpR family DNA-binding transcriptional regulator [Zetaproteobacteria bacterium CG06_land_8_20_14_3_00_59_53]PIU96713.1 MA